MLKKILLLDVANFILSFSLLWLNILALILIGVFVALAYVPTYQALLQHAV